MKAAVARRANEIAATMPDMFPPGYAEFLAEAEEQRALLLSSHRALTRPGAWTTCTHPDCEGIRFEGTMDVFRHQARMIAGMV